MKNESLNTNEAPEQNTKTTKPKKAKLPLAARIVNIVTAVIILLALVFALQAVYARKHLHNNYFGFAMLPVKTNSMKLDKDKAQKDNFERGDLIFVKILKDDQKRELKVGDVITFKFYQMDDDQQQLNTHRIIEILSDGYMTQGDAETAPGIKSKEKVDYSMIVGVYRSKIQSVGHFFLFLETKPGMFVIIVLPFIFLLLLSIFYFIRNYKLYNKEKVEEVAESTIVKEKERLRAEILKEMQDKNQTASEQNNDTD